MSDFPNRDAAADFLADKYATSEGWGEHPTYSRADWKYEVENGDTQAGYWVWVVNSLGADEESVELDDVYDALSKQQAGRA